MTDQTQRLKVGNAHKNALRDLALFRSAQAVFGKTLQETAGDVPPGLGIAHALYYNPSLTTNPEISKEGRRGFLKLTQQAAYAASIAWEKLDIPEVCAYVWNHGMNMTGMDVWASSSLFFPAPTTDFWNTVYVRYLLGVSNFDKVWKVRDTEQQTVLGSLIYGVLNSPPNLPGWNNVTLMHFFSYALPYVTFLWARGGLSLTGGYGKLPTLPGPTVTTAFLE